MIMLESLSPREREVVERLAAGQHQKGIAGELRISISAVRQYCDRAKLKLGAQTVTHLAVIYSVQHRQT